MKMTKRQAIEFLIEKKISFRVCKNCLFWESNSKTNEQTGSCEEICEKPNEIFKGLSRVVESGRMSVVLNKVETTQGFGCNKFQKTK
jgi:hypothetical protein